MGYFWEHVYWSDGVPGRRSSAMCVKGPYTLISKSGWPAGTSVEHMSAGMSIAIDLWATQGDMYIGMCTDMCVHLWIYICVGMCADICIPTGLQESL